MAVGGVPVWTSSNQLRHLSSSGHPDVSVKHYAAGKTDGTNNQLLWTMHACRISPVAYWASALSRCGTSAAAEDPCCWDKICPRWRAVGQLPPHPATVPISAIAAPRMLIRGKQGVEDMVAQTHRIIWRYRSGLLQAKDLRGPGLPRSDTAQYRAAYSRCRWADSPSHTCRCAQCPSTGFSGHLRRVRRLLITFHMVACFIE